jgi:hypothetical protein
MFYMQHVEIIFTSIFTYCRNVVYNAKKIRQGSVSQEVCFNVYC